MRRDAWAYGVGTILHRIHPLSENLLLTALLPIEDFGRWSVASAFYIGIVSLMHGGVPAAVLRYVPLYPQAKESLLRYALLRITGWGVGGIIFLISLTLTVERDARLLLVAHGPALIAVLWGETLRAYLRGGYENVAFLRWQAISVPVGLGLLGVLAAEQGLIGAAIVRLLQPLWGLLPLLPYIVRALRAPVQTFPGFNHFGYNSLWGNLALEGIFFLPGWFIGWRGTAETAAYWRWATLIPLNLRSLFAQAVMYFYPHWVQMSYPPLQWYKRYAPYLHGAAWGVGLSVSTWGLFWAIFPGEAYLPARPYFFWGTVVGYLWSTEALLFPNLLSARGKIQLYSLAYAGGLLVALPWYGWAGESLAMYLIGLGAAAVSAALVAAYFLWRDRYS
ncbi:MAG: hypothetical protein NZ580_06500 [Bacteroidia bacterium]|nr:hypothetical protein [Bacteroidia bacterium]MDW8236524.1 hypothetical protein [Bacteroidia bacterium]